MRDREIYIFVQQKSYYWSKYCLKRSVLRLVWRQGGKGCDGERKEENYRSGQQKCKIYLIPITCISNIIYTKPLNYCLWSEHVETVQSGALKFDLFRSDICLCKTKLSRTINKLMQQEPDPPTPLPPSSCWWLPGHDRNNLFIKRSLPPFVFQVFVPIQSMVHWPLTLNELKLSLPLEPVEKTGTPSSSWASWKDWYI